MDSTYFEWSVKICSEVGHSTFSTLWPREKKKCFFKKNHLLIFQRNGKKRPFFYIIGDVVETFFMSSNFSIMEWYWQSIKELICFGTNIGWWLMKNNQLIKKWSGAKIPTKFSNQYIPPAHLIWDLSLDHKMKLITLLAFQLRLWLAFYKVQIQNCIETSLCQRIESE